MYTKKFYLHEITATHHLKQFRFTRKHSACKEFHIIVNWRTSLYKSFLKNAKKTCKPNNGDLNRN